MTGLGVRVKELRKAKGWSAQKLADGTGGVVTRDMIAGLEIGRTRDISLRSALALARSFGMSVEQLVDEDVPVAAYVAAAEIASAKLRLEAQL